MKPDVSVILEKAFKKPNTDDTSVAIGKLYAENGNNEYSEDDFQKFIQSPERNLVLSLTYLKDDLGILKSYPLIRSNHVKAGEIIPIVYKMKDEYFSVFQKMKDKLF